MKIAGNHPAASGRKSIKVNSYSALLMRLLIIMVMFSVCRVAFFLFNTDQFPDMTMQRFFWIMAGGLKFDLSATLYVNLLFILASVTPFKYRHNLTYQKSIKILFFVTNGIALAFNCADFIYYRFVQKRTTSTIFEAFANEEILGSLFMQFFLDFWYVYLFWGGMMAAVVYLYGHVNVAKPEKYNNILFYGGSVLMVPVIVVLVVAGCRGGFAHSTRPITLSNAGKYVEKPSEMSIVLNTPFAIIRTINKKPLKRLDYFASEKEMASVFDAHYRGDAKGSFRKRNVVIMILESFGSENSKLLNPDLEGEGYMPFLDSLMEKGLTYRNSFANGLKSIDALPTILAGIPALEVPYVLSHHSHNRINSVASLLKTKGYATSFFHGAPNGSMGFQSFVHLAGFDSYFGKDEYGNDDDYDGMWGIWDEEFFQFFARTLNQEQEPFCTAIFSVSSHHPFKVPEKHNGRFKEGKYEINMPVSYTDYALRKFFETASEMPWFENTLFVITADHTLPRNPENKNSRGFFDVPIVFYTPDGELRGFEETIVQQTDILPSIMSYLNYDGDFITFGNDVFDSETDHFALNYIHGTYQLFMEDFLLLFRDGAVVGLYNFKEDRQSTSDLSKEMPAVRAKLEKKIKAILQQYNNRMLDNNITVATAAGDASSTLSSD